VLIVECWLSNTAMKVVVYMTMELAEYTPLVHRLDSTRLASASADHSRVRCLSAHVLIVERWLSNTAMKVVVCMTMALAEYTPLLMLCRQVVSMTW
jgi:hypothetical protein